MVIILTIYDEKEKNFNTLGLGILPNPISLNIIEELNGIYSLDLQYPKIDERWRLLERGKILKADNQLFRIFEVEDDIESVKVIADHIFYDLLDNLIEDIFIREGTGAYAIQHILNNTQFKHDFTGWSDIIDLGSSRLIRKNPVQAILSDDENSFINRWGGEIKRDNFSIKMYRKLGNNNGVTIRYRKNLLGYKRSINDRDLATRIMPKGYDGLLLPEKYIDSPLLIDYSHPKIKIIDIPEAKVILPENATEDEPAMSEEQCFEIMRKKAKELYLIDKVDIPKINIEVSFVDLEYTEEYKDLKILERVNLGDTITIYLDDLGLKLEYRVIKVTKDLLKKVNRKVEIGDFKSNIYTFLNSNNASSNSGGGSVGGGDYLTPGDIPVLEKDFLEKAKKEATNLINSGFGGYARYYPDRVLIMDTDDEMTATKVWQFNKNGLGYSSNGINGPYELAMTSNGAIVADFIKAGELNGALIRAGSIIASQLSIQAKNEIREGLVTTVQHTADLGGINSKFTTVEKDINSNKSKITEVEQKVTPSAIISVVSEKLVTEGNENLIENSTFTYNLDKWVKWNWGGYDGAFEYTIEKGGTGDSDSPYIPLGATALRLSAANSTDGVDINCGLYQSYISVDPNTDYTLSLYVGNHRCNSAIEVKTDQAGDALVSYTFPLGGASADTASATGFKSYQYKSFTFNSGSRTSVFLTYYIHQSIGGNSVSFLSRLMMCKGTITKQWCIDNYGTIIANAKATEFKQDLDGFKLTTSNNIDGLNTKYSQFKQDVDGFKLSVGQKLDVTNIVDNGGFVGGLAGWSATTAEHWSGFVTYYGLKNYSASIRNPLLYDGSINEKYLYSARAYRVKRNSTYTFSFAYVVEQNVYSMDAFIILSAIPQGDYSHPQIVDTFLGGTQTDNANGKHATYTFFTGDYDYVWVRFDHNGMKPNTNVNEQCWIYVSEVAIYEGDVGDIKWQPNPNEIRSITVNIDQNGLNVGNGAISVSNNAGTKVIHGDSNGNVKFHGEMVIQNMNTGYMKQRLTDVLHEFYEGHGEGVLCGEIFSAYLSANENSKGLALSVPTHAKGTSISINRIPKFFINNGHNPNNITENVIISGSTNFRKQDINGVLRINRNELKQDIWIQGMYIVDNEINVALGGTPRLWLNYWRGNGINGADTPYPTEVHIGNGGGNGHLGHLQCGSLGVTGSKNAIQTTDTYGDVKVNAYETADYYFGDIGCGTVVDGECIIMIDDKFRECINSDINYHVFLTKYGAGDIYVSERNSNYFVVKGDNISFSWEIKGKRKGFENNRLEVQTTHDTIKEYDYFEKDANAEMVEDIRKLNVSVDTIVSDVEKEYLEIDYINNKILEKQLNFYMEG